MSTDEFKTLFVSLAEKEGLLGEVCRLVDYDPTKGAVPEHFAPRHLTFFMKLVDACTASPTPPQAGPTDGGEA